MSVTFLEHTKLGLYCKPGHFYVDPWQPVECACVTHAHADHARYGMKQYVATPASSAIMQKRLGKQINIEIYGYHQPFKKGDVTCYFIPAGHILGSAQLVIEYKGKRAIVTGDYKLSPDKTVEAFEHLDCDLLVTESTFALPCFRWPSQEQVFSDIQRFWYTNQAKGFHTVLYAYSLGKAQRLLAGLDWQQGPIAVHGAVDEMNQIYVNYGKLDVLPPRLTLETLSTWKQPGLVVTPPSTAGSAWLKKLKRYREAYVSGWMQIKGQTRRKNMRGFVLSDHIDWPQLNETVLKSKAKEVWVTHGFSDIYAQYLNEKGIQAKSLDYSYFEREEQQ